MIYATQAHVYGWGSDQNARRVRTGSLTKTEREAIAAGADVHISGCPAYRGVTVRRVVCVNGRYFTRMPRSTQQ